MRSGGDPLTLGDLVNGRAAQGHRGRRRADQAAGVVARRRHGRPQGERRGRSSPARTSTRRTCSGRACCHGTGDPAADVTARRSPRSTQPRRRRRGPASPSSATATSSACVASTRPRTPRRRRVAGEGARGAGGGRPVGRRRCSTTCKSTTAGGGAGSSTRATSTPRARRRPATIRGDLHGRLHRALPARAARGGGRVERRQADRLDRHAAAVRRAGRAGRRVPHPDGSRARDRAGHRVGLRRQAHRRRGDRGRAAGARRRASR